MEAKENKLSLPQQEEKILEFWEKNKIFEKSILQRKNAKQYVFYDGPPFATGLPHYGHILASTIKDVVPRYWTMRGFRVDRRWGWDTHGLPIEALVEQELNISGKKAIRKHGIKKFNETARSKVLAYTSEWFKTVRRIGRFVDFKNAYTTMDPTYMESVLWAFSTLFKKGLVYKDSRTALFCPRCETQLSNFEIAMDNSYRDKEDDSVYVKLKLKGEKNEYLLVWTTTPWTLPGNTAVAVNPQIEYTKYRITVNKNGNKKTELIWAATTPPYDLGTEVAVIEKTSGKSLINKQYDPLFALADVNTAYRVVGADFVSTEEGTGLVHIAPAFGEEDFLLGKKEKLPILATLDDTGRFMNTFPALSFLAGKTAADANPIVIEWLKKGGFLWKVQKIMHRYPICWRCSTPLIYKVEPAWFIKISAIKKKMLELNEKIDWHPQHLKHGRFGNGLETAPDWNISRSRFWGTPIPIWECKACNKIHVLGSREEIHKRSDGAKNQYLVMRHGEAENNISKVYATAWPETKKHHLTLKGRKKVEASAKRLRSEKIDLIVSSPFTRTKETAEIVASALGIKIEYDERLREMSWGALHDMPADEEPFSQEQFTVSPPGGENLSQVRTRAFSVVKDLEHKYQGKKILIVSHGDPLWMLSSAMLGLSDREAIEYGEKHYPEKGIANKIEYKILPRNESGEIDFHLPYIDEVLLQCDCGEKLSRIPDVFDCWFESGSMPYAEKHYPFENKKLFEENFPAHFIAEYIAQTRGWFNKLHELSTALFGKPSFLHAITTGTIMAENGEKLSKSKKNYPDPWLLFERYGVDAIRYYLMASPVMLAENINFSEKDVDEIYKKYSLISYNVLSFFKLYEHRLPKKPSSGKSTQILDRWITSRLHSTIEAVTKGFDTYEAVNATRPLLDFVQDLSLWYVRRSRERVKSESKDALKALATLNKTLHTLACLMAPVTPFLAEVIYRDLPQNKKISVHLENWPAFNKKLIDKKLESDMALVRGIISDALRLRAQAGIKVRQPLRELKITNKELRKKTELLELIKNELNVKEIAIGEEMKLDTIITPELHEEGLVREFVRNIQEMRRDLGLKPQHLIRIQISGNTSVEETISRWEKTIAKDTNAREVKIGGKKLFDIERELSLYGSQLWVGINKL